MIVERFFPPYYSIIEDMNYKIVEVTWIDAWADQATMSRDAVKDAKPITRLNVGYILRDDDECIVMTHGLVGDDDIDMLFTIPRQMILGTRELKFVD